MRKLEERSSELESRMHRREEEFRKADNDRMKKFFYAARFDNIGGALNGNSGETHRSLGGTGAFGGTGVSSSRSKGFRDN